MLKKFFMIIFLTMSLAAVAAAAGKIATIQNGQLLASPKIKNGVTLCAHYPFGTQVEILGTVATDTKLKDKPLELYKVRVLSDNKICYTSDENLVIK